MTSQNFELHDSRWLMDPGGLSPFVQAFARHLAGLDYRRETIAHRADCARHFCVWLNGEGMTLADIDVGTIERFARHRCRCGGNRPKGPLSAPYVHRVRRFIGFLAETGVIDLPRPRPVDTDARLAAYLAWLSRHRGLSDATIASHRKMLQGLWPVLGADPAAYDSRLLQQIVLEKVGRDSRGSAKNMVSVLRSYLRFLGTRGECPTRLADAVPTIAQWSVSALPRYLPSADVERLIAACNLRTPAGVRDRAILLLLARFGLRAGDVLDMRLEDIDWENGALRLRGKGRREVRLPLTQDVGDALLAYLSGARPEAASSHVFLRSSAPYRPFSESTAISAIVARALRRAGIEDAPSRGAHLLRHSAATTMLGAGATLATIGAVLRHRSADTTARCAKVDLPSLRQIAQPWPGDAPC